MDRQIVVFGTDDRQRSLSAALPGQVISLSWEEYERQGTAQMGIYVLPTPVTKLENQEIIQKLKVELINRRQ